MNHVYLCDDDPEWLKKIESYVFRYQMQSRWTLNVSCAADSPGSLLRYLEEHRPSSGIYFLDIGFKDSMSGLDLGAKIRKIDSDATLIFVTTHDELALETLRYQLMALDYILKDLPDVEGQIRRVLQCLKERFQAEKNSYQDKLRIKTIGEGYYFLPRKDIYYIEAMSGRHKSSVHTGDKILPTSYTLSELSQKLGENFVLCHKSYLVNLDHVKKLQPASLDLLLDNQETLHCSVRAWSRLIKHFHPQPQFQDPKLPEQGSNLQPPG